MSLADDVLVESDDRGRSVVILSRWGELKLAEPTDVARDLLRRMSLGPVSLANVMPMRKPASGDDSEWAGLEQVLDTLSGSIVRSVGLRDRRGPLLSAIPSVAAPAFRPSALAGPRRARLSRFATMRRCGENLSLESPCAQYAVQLHQPMAARVAVVLARATTVAEIAEVIDAAASVVGEIVAYLVAAGVVVTGNDGGFAEDEDPVLGLWTHHELTFHQRSRSRQGVGPCDDGVPGEQPISPVTKPRPPGRRFELHRPDLGRTTATDASLDTLLEQDHGCPEFSGRELSRAQVGELLFRAARIRGPGPPHLPHGMSHAASQRPYLSIACLYELELYLSLDRCEELPRGIYHYDPAGHALTLVNDDEAELGGMLDMAKVAAGCVQRPPAMISMTARMARLTALGGAAYATALLHVGALHQTLSLVARAMGLTAHPVAIDANDMVQRALRLPWPAEIGVGECVVDCPD